MDVLRKLQDDRSTAGYVDLDNGIIYRTSTNIFRRALSYIAIAAVMALGAGIVLVLQQLIVGGTSLGIGSLDANLTSVSPPQPLLLYVFTASLFSSHKPPAYLASRIDTIPH